MFLLTLLAVLAFFPMIFAALMTFSAIRKKEYEFAIKSGAVFLICLFIVVMAPKGKPHLSDGCRSYGRFASDC